MPITNVIVNGTFTDGSNGWTGTDMETNYNENTYLGNGSPNRVAEMDGNSSQTTIMFQNFAVSHAGTFPLSFRGAMRSGVSTTVGEGFQVEIIDSTGTVLFVTHILPGSTNWETYSFDITFPTAGNYTIKFTELGPNDSLGALLDDVQILVCFAAGTLIDTPDGPRAVESLVLGDLVSTLDGAAQAIRWVGHREVGADAQLADPKLRPVVFAPGSLGHGLPRRPLAVSQLHRMLVDDWRSQLYFAEEQVLIAARALVNGDTVRLADAAAPVTYVHFLLDGHQIVRAEGAASESFYPSATSLRGVEAEARDELLTLFPDLPLADLPLARPALRSFEAKVLAQG